MKLEVGLGLAITLVPMLLVQARNRGDEEWDVLIFTQQWPITSCTSHQQHPGHPSCNLYPNMTTWTVHGIWPTKLGTIGPNNCNQSWVFEEAEIIPIEGLLVKYWGNIFAAATTTSLWKHEWQKHGTCAAQLSALNSERKYFGKGLEWVLKYDLVATFTQHSIYMGDLTSYSLDQIFSVLKDTFGVNTAIDCYYNKEKKQHELWQVKLCFDRSLVLVDCDGIIGRERGLEGAGEEDVEREAIGNCPTTGIVYPSSVRTGGHQFVYTRELADQHTQQRWAGLGGCEGGSWVCRALLTVFSLMWITL